MELDNKRMQQLTFMFSDITGIVPDVSREIILGTDTGKAVHRNDMTVIYEQQTENLYSIAMELKKIQQYSQFAQSLSTENIVTAMEKLAMMDKQEKTNKEVITPHVARQPGLKTKERERILAERKSMLQIKKQNQLNVRRIENATNLKG